MCILWYKIIFSVKYMITSECIYLYLQSGIRDPAIFSDWLVRCRPLSHRLPMETDKNHLQLTTLAYLRVIYQRMFVYVVLSS